MMDLSVQIEVLRAAIRYELAGETDLYHALKGAFDPKSVPTADQLGRDQLETRATMDAGSARRGAA